MSQISVSGRLSLSFQLNRLILTNVKIWFQMAKMILVFLLTFACALPHVESGKLILKRGNHGNNDTGFSLRWLTTSMSCFDVTAAPSSTNVVPIIAAVTHK